MATNPQRPPEPPRLKDDHAHVVTTKARNAWWPIVIIVVAAAILVALIVWLPRSPHQVAPPSAAQVPPQPTGSQIQFTNLRMSTPTPAGAVNLTGSLLNNGNQAITGVTVEATFRGINGNNLETKTVEAMGFDNSGQTYDLLKQPIKPQSTARFELRFDRVSEGWDRNLPALRITQVRAEGK